MNKKQTEMNRRKYYILSLLVLLVLGMQNVHAQQPVSIHSHNDYYQLVPFYQAYAQRVTSIEVDVFHQEGQLLVGHDLWELSPERTLEALYVEPIVKVFTENEGRAWPGSEARLTLMIDLKTSYNPALDSIAALLSKYPHVFDLSKNPNAARVVISGDMPPAERFEEYPLMISFDGRLDQSYTEEQLERVAMMSAPFHAFASWNGKGLMKAPEKAKVQQAIEQSHALGKPIRFWATPDGVTAWNTLYHMGVEIINTDHVEQCAAFFDGVEDKNYRFTEENAALQAGVDRTDRLDKITAGFKGFNKEEIMLSGRVATYTPTYRNDGSEGRIKNVILLIGDGMGLNHVSAAETVNQGLTMLALRYIGLQSSHPKDGYTSDSAASGSALATGKPHNNRSISADEEGNAIPTLAERAHDKGLATGIVTLGNLADATPAAFYGHSVERDSADLITRYLLDGKINMVVGGGSGIFTDREDGLTRGDFETVFDVHDSVDQMETGDRPILCVDDLMEYAATEETLDLLATATRKTILKLEEDSDQGFFLMVEGAKIDYAGHANSLAGTISETLSFDLAVAEALRYADSNGETLVIVTADHETGGLVLVDGDKEEGLITARFTTDDHTPAKLGVFAYGPGAQHFIGFYPNYDIANKISKLLELR